jgi:hypothetical protein
VGTVSIPLSQGKCALIDAADVPRVCAYKWYALTTRGGKTYACRNIRRPDGRRTTQYLHRFLAGAPDGLEVDHRNGDGLDCRRENLRCATRPQNCANVPKAAQNTSGYIGVSWRKDRCKWIAQIQVQGKHIHIGQFDSPEAAAEARARYARDVHGEFASRDEVAS